MELIESRHIARAVDRLAGSNRSPSLLQRLAAIDYQIRLRMRPFAVAEYAAREAEKVASDIWEQSKGGVLDLDSIERQIAASLAGAFGVGVVAYEIAAEA